MKPKSTLRSFLLLAGSSLLAISSASAATLYYDGGTADIAGNGDSAASGLTGDWSTSLKNWDAGSVPYVGWNNNDIAFFHRGTAIPGPNPGTVSLTSDITVGGLVFNASTYTISTGANALTFGGTNNTIALNNKVTAANITGTVSSSAANMTLTAQNPATNHTLTFNGANTTGWTGTTTVNSGATLAVEGSTGNQALGFTSAITLNGGSITTGTGITSAHNTVDFFNDSAAITANGGGSFTWRPVNADTFNETIGAIIVNGGQFNLLTASQSGPGLATLTTASITRTSSTSALNFSLGNNGPLPSTGGTNFIQVSGSGTTAGWTDGDPSNSIIGAWATTGTSGAAIDYAIYSANMVRSANTVASAETTWTNAAKQYTLSIPSVTTSGASTALTASRNVAALRVSSNTTSLSSATVAASPTFTITGHTLAVGDPVVLGGTAPGGFSTGRVYYVAGIDTDTFTLSATPGGAAINATNAQTPNVTTGLKLDLNKNLGTTGILNGGTAPIGIGRTADGGHVTLPAAGTGNLFVTAVAGALSIDAPIVDNDGALTLVKSGASNLFLTGNNTYTGGTVVNAGNVTVSGTNTFATGAAGADVINGGSLTYSTLAAWGGTGRDVTFNGTGTLTSTVGGYSGGTLTSNSGANAIIAAGGGSLAFATTTGAGNVIFSSGANRLLNLGDASGLTGNLQSRLTGNANYGTATSIQFSGIGDAVGSAIQFVGGQGDGNQPMTVAYNGSAPLVFNNRQIEIQDRLTSNWEIRYNILANNSSNAANTWTINTDLLYTGGSAITAFGGSLQANRTLRLSGTNTGDNAFNGVISNGQNTNGLHVDKDGSGKWTLSGANSYTGPTSVTAGTLIVNGDQSAATGAVAVNGTSTLGGSGTLGGSVTVAAGAKLAPGASVGTLSIGGGLTISAMAGGAGKLFYELGTIAASDRIAVTGTLDIGDGLLGIGDFDFTNVGGLQEGVYTLITSGGITGTLDGTNLQGTIGETDITLGTSGSSIILTVGTPSGTPYELWAGGAAFGDDANGDGVSNGLAFLLGASGPNVSALGLLPTVSQSGGGLVMTFSMLNSANRGTASLSVQHSSDLGISDAWTTVLVPDTAGISGPTSGVTFNVTLGSPSNTVTATISSSEAAFGKLFGRLKATE